ncbi:MAG: cellulase family glycosylhydrolase [Lachnospiraceae bacterium]|nr:cellulase family glycosylhydrolase [Lachnospiraceae bacterium]
MLALGIGLGRRSRDAENSAQDRTGSEAVSGVAQDSSADAAADQGGAKEDTMQNSAQNKNAQGTDGANANGVAATDGANANGAAATDGYVLHYEMTGSWDKSGVTMCGLNLGIANHAGTPVNGWTVELTIPGLAEVSGWNGNFTANADTLTIANVEYNGEIADGVTVYTGCNLGVKGDFQISSATLNGVPMTVEAGKVDQNAQNNQNQTRNQNQNQNQNGQGSVDVAKLLEHSPAAVQGDDWLHTDGRKIYDKDGREVWLTGASWFGYNTGTNLFDGLWNSELVSTVDAIADHGLNLIRVPISAQLINQWAAGDYPRANYNNAYNTALNSMNSLEIFDYFLVLAEQNGLKVMMDIHSAETDAAGHNVNLWYTDKVSVEEYYAALTWLAARYKDNDTIIAIDLKNEPHGKPGEGSKAAIWNDSKAANNWKYVAETAASKVLAQNPNVLIVVEGTEIYPKDIKTNGDYRSQDSEDYYFNWWGGNLRGVADHPINLGKYQDKLVYSPHDYGPTVFQQPWFEGNYTYDSLMKDCWHDNWFYIYEDDIAPLLIGEWGGFMREPNLSWMTDMRQLIKKYRLNHTFWCINANSGDTGGLLLDDFKTWDEEKYAFVKEVLWQENGKFVGLDHAIPLGSNGISLSELK